MSHFDESAGIEACNTSWGKWWQTMEEVYIEICNPEPLKSKDVKIEISTTKLSCIVHANLIFKGDLYQAIRADESTWTLEDKKIIKIMLAKSQVDASNCWSSILTDGTGQSDPLTLDRMQQKLTLQRFQTENPGMDFSGAAISGNYQSGGPRLPS